MVAVDEIPSIETIKEAGDLEIFDQEGKKIKFASLYADKQTMVIFIRHFLCGNCMEYVSVLSSKVDPAEVAAKGMQIAIIGCGDYAVIESYTKDSGSKFLIYADPTQKVYDMLGMIRTLSLGDKRPEYMSVGLVGGIIKGIKNALRAGGKAFKAGDIKQVGGEFFLGPGDKCEYAHRMQNTRDHTEIPALRQVMGLDTA